MARPIDADALQELCNRRIQDTWNSGVAPVSWAEAYADFKDDIDSMPPLTPPNEWVSVEDAMPPELKMVLVYCGGLYDVAGWVKNEDGEVCWTCKTAPDFWRQIPEME